MKKYLFILIFIFCQSLVLAQTKFAESKGRDGGTGESELNEFIKQLKQAPDTNGFIIIHSGKNREMLGNILSFISAAKSDAAEKLGDEKRLSFAVTESKQVLSIEFWIIPKGKKKPEVKEIQINLDNLKTKYFYANMCLDCFRYNPNLKLFAKTIKKHPNYKVLIVVHFTGIYWGERMKRELIEDYNINSNQIMVEEGIKPNSDPNLPSFIHPVYDFYIVPTKTNVRN